MNHVIRTRLFSVLLVGVAVFIGLGLLSAGTARAQTVPTTGTAPQGSGGSASVASIGDLFKFPCTTGGVVDPLGSGMWCVDGNNYDDDPNGQPGGSVFYGTPNVADAPLRHAWKIVIIDFGNPSTNDVKAIQKTIKWTSEYPTTLGPDKAGLGNTVLEEVVDLAQHPTGLLTGNNCSLAMGAAGTNNTPADGLVDTGQVSGADMQNWINRCIQSEVGVHFNNWTISKHLPPGDYSQCITLLYQNGSASTPVCDLFWILPVNHYVIDFGAGIAWANLVQNAKSVVSGDWDLATPLKPTIQGDGNTSMVVAATFSRLVNNQGTPNDPNDDKVITRYFDIQLNRKNAGGTLVEFVRADNILENAQTILNGPTTTIGGRPNSLNGLCLEPNEPLKLDFSVTPFEPVWPGTYTGTVLIQAGVQQTVCSPSLDSGESTTGDSNGPFNNNPSQP